MKVSPQGNFIIAPFYSDSPSHHIIDTKNFGSGKDFNVTHHSPYSYYIQNRLTDVGTVVVDDNNGFYIYDIAKQKVMASVSATYFSNICVTSSGKYILVESDSVRLYKYENEQLRQLWNKSRDEFGYGDYWIHPFEEGKIYKQNIVENGFYGSITIRNLEDYSKIGEYDLGTNIASIDFYRNEFLCYKDGTCCICDFNTGEVKKRLDIHSIGYGFQLFNHCIYSPYGIKYNVNQ